MNEQQQSPLTRAHAFFSAIRRALSEFLWTPTLVILGFLLLAVGTYLLDRASWAWLEPIKHFLHTYIFADVAATAQLLRTTAGGLMTVTSVTISVLLLALQQSAAAMTTAVFDQFLRRRQNQLYFGFFVGLALYTLVTLATVNAPFNPVISAIVALVLTVVALFLLILLLYTTVNQIRPTEIIDTIHYHTLAARQRQLGLLASTRRSPQYAGPISRAVTATQRGMVTAIAVDALGTTLAKMTKDVEIVIKAPIGAYVAFGDELAIIHAATEDAADTLEKAVMAATTIERQRDITTDPDYGIEQMMTIAWSSISSAKSDIAPGLLTIYSLRDILARWSAEAANREAAAEPPLPIVYPDRALIQSINALESLAVISSESLQYQAFAEVLRTLADLFSRLPTPVQEHTMMVIQRLLSALGDHVLTTELDQALTALTTALTGAGHLENARAVEEAQSALRRSLGTLHSRATRAGWGWGKEDLACTPSYHAPSATAQNERQGLA
ncbi:MAG: DUF2254 domain-containing protein [Caldilineaceae bacterium]|nr:DUF2254 domain-containing protein [Caldilineaceae bacterium]